MIDVVNISVPAVSADRLFGTLSLNSTSTSADRWYKIEVSETPEIKEWSQLSSDAFWENWDNEFDALYDDL